MPATTPPHSQSGAAAPGGAEPAHDEGARLQALAHYAILDTPAEAAFDEIAALAAVLCQAPTALVGFVAEDRQWFKARVGLALQETPRCEAICHTTIQQPEPLFVVPDTTQDPRFAGLPLARAPDGFRFYAGALLRTPAGLVVGTLCVLDRQPRSLTPAQATGLQTLARQVMAQMELRRQRSQVQQARAGREAELANQRLLQAALTKGEQRLARLAAQVPGVVFQFQMRPDGSTCFPYASDGLHALFGVGPDQVVDDATPAISRVLPEDRARLADSMAESARDLTVWEGEYRTQVPGRPTIWLQGRSQPERLPDGSTLWHGFMTDISARKASEQLLRERDAALLQAQRLARLGSWRWSRAEQRSEWSEETCRLFGIDPARRMIDDADFMRFVHPEDAALVMQAHLAALASLQPYQVQYRIQAADGVERTLHARAEFLHDPQSGELQGMVGTLLDVTDRVAAERELQRHRDQLERLVEARTRELIAARDQSEQANRAKGEFLSSMSHELRTPMNAILGFAQLLQLERGLDPRSAGYVREILRAGQHLLELINEVLDLARIEAGKLSLSPEPLPLADLMAETMALVLPLAQQRQVAVHAASLQGLVVRADRLRLKQVLLNLLSNAVKYNRAQGAVYVDAQLQDLFAVRIRVRDTGIGIAPRHLKQLFQPFSRVGSAAAEGTGIGLSISQRLVLMMGGRIGVHSEPGRGSEFWVELPSDRLADPPPPLVEPAEPVPSGFGTLSALQRTAPARVLYVEDNPANLKLVEQILARHTGVELLVAPSGGLGLDLARSHEPDLLLLDIHLPDLDGFQVLARLRADDATRHIPVVAVTAQAMPEDVRRVREAGFDDYLAKPLELKRFDELLARMLTLTP